MLPTWTLLGLGGVMLAVGGTLFDKYLLSKYFADYEDGEAGPGALLIFSAYFSSFIIIGLLLYGYTNITFDIQPMLYALIAGVLNGIWILMYLYAISRADVSKTAPILQTIPAFGLLLAFVTLGEVLTTMQLYAVAVLAFGAIVLLHEPKEGLLNIDTKTLGLMLGSSFFVALSQTLFKVGTNLSGYINATVWLWVGFLFFGILLHIAVPKYKRQFGHMFSQRIRNVFSLNAANEAFDSVGELLFFGAIMIGPLALVQSLNTYEPMLIFVTSVILTLLYPKYFKESLTTQALVQKVFGILVLFVGTLILYNNL